MRDVVAASLPRARTYGAGALRRLAAVPPWRVLTVFVLLQWALVLGLAVTVRHNGWIYYQGGDQLWYYTGAWLLTHGQFWNAGVGYFWTLPMAPLAAIVGPNVANAYPAIIVVQVVVLLPLVLVTMYALGARIAGRLFGYWVALLWLVVPLIAIKFANPGYHQRFTETLLPQGFGLTAMADLPTMAAVTVSGYFCLRALCDDVDADFSALIAGLAAGAAIAIKSSSALYLAGPALGFLVTQRSRAAAAFGLGLVPYIIALSVQKYRGFGYLPLFQGLGGGVRVAAGATLAPLGAINVHRYLPFHWGIFVAQLDQLREYFWSARLVEWLVVAGAAALLIRSPRICALVVGWFGAIVVLKAGSGRGDLQGGNLLRLVMPAYPAFVLLLASLPFLVPGAARRIPRPAPSHRIRLSRNRRIGAVAAVIALTALLPIGVYAATSPIHGPTPRAAYLQQPPIPIGIGLGVQARAAGGGTRLTWKAQSTSSGKVFYRVFRTRPGVAPLECPDAETSVPRTCTFELDDLGATRTTSFVDRHPRRGSRYYVGVAANWLNDITQGDVYELSAPVAVHGP